MEVRQDVLAVCGIWVACCLVLSILVSGMGLCLSWGRVGHCLTRFVTSLEIAACGARCCCLQSEVSLAHGLYGACFSAFPVLRM